jgi:hypothetical protein
VARLDAAGGARTQVFELGAELSAQVRVDAVAAWRSAPEAAWPAGQNGGNVLDPAAHHPSGRTAELHVPAIRSGCGVRSWC